MENIKLMQGDCLELMKNIPDGSVDLVLCDLPYGVLNKGNPNATWDKRLPFECLWSEYLRVAKDNAAFILFTACLWQWASQYSPCCSSGTSGGKKEANSMAWGLIFIFGWLGIIALCIWMMGRGRW